MGDEVKLEHKGKEIVLYKEDYLAILDRFNPEKFEEEGILFVTYSSKASCPLCERYIAQHCCECPFEIFEFGYERGCMAIIVDLLEVEHVDHIAIITMFDRVSFYKGHRDKAVEELNKIMDFLKEASDV